MDIEIKDTITLSDKRKYLVVSKVQHQNNTYYYLVDEQENENVKFCLEKAGANTLLEINDANLIQNLLPLFSSKTKQHLEENN
ncbi:MAG: hypothetical protein FWC91_13880 [Defluviitaleaceae bacterium]|nr:hypothetical protein [Defluviitaleaceae bacterium]